MREPIVVATAGPFELMETCYVHDCDRLAVLETSGGAMCLYCYTLMNRAQVSGELHYKLVYDGFPDAAERNLEVDKRMRGWRPVYPITEDIEQALVERDNK